MEEKTEKPTSKHLRDARKKGQVLKSKEATDAASYCVVVAAMLGLIPWVWRRLQNVFELGWSTAALHNTRSFWTDVLGDVGRELAWLIIVLALMVAASVAAATLVQIRGVFSAEPVKPDIKRINPAEGFKRIFSTVNLFNFLKRLLALTLICGVTVWVLLDFADELLHLTYVAPIEAARTGGRLIMVLLVIVGFTFVVFAAVDFAHQFYEFMKRMRMSKDDVRREHKDMEGDPHIRGERRRLFRELTYSAVGDATRAASVLLVNPTHYAVAVLYEPGVTELPMVVEKAVEKQALFLREAARQAGVPIFEYPLLARELYWTTPAFRFVPQELFPAISEVLMWVRGLKPPPVSADA